MRIHWLAVVLAAVPPARSQAILEVPTIAAAPLSVDLPRLDAESPILEVLPAPLAQAYSISSDLVETKKAQARPALKSLERQLILLKARLDAAPDPAGFSSGDIAILGSEHQTVMVTARGETLTGRLPSLVRVHDAASNVIDLPLSRPNGHPALMRMKNQADKLRAAPIRPVESALLDLRASILPRVSFMSGEVVRVRDESTGRIERMTYMRRHRPIRDLFRPLQDRGLIVRDRQGELWTAPRRVVFKDAGVGDPFTLKLIPPSNYNWARFEPGPAGLIRSFLDGAAWLGSHPEYLAATHEERWKAFASYVDAVLRPGDLAHKAEFLDLGFPELLGLGMGVCRHSATLAMAVLREAGYDARLMLRVESGKSEGHTWTVVRAPEGSGVQPWILDLTNGNVLSWSEAEAQAAQSPDSLAARWYLHPDSADLPPSI